MYLRKDFNLFLLLSCILVVSWTYGINEDYQFVFCVPEVVYFRWYDSNSSPHVLIATDAIEPVDTSVTVHGTGFEARNVVTRNSFVDVLLPPSVYMIGTGVKGNQTVIVRANALISVHVMVNDVFGGDGFLALPTKQLGTNHYVLAFAGYRNPYSTHESFICVSNFNKKTMIEIKINATKTYNIVLQPYESFQQTSNLNDILGSQVSSNNPISVLAGLPLVCTRYCTALIEQIPSVHTWGTRAILSPFAGRNDGYGYAVIGTKVTTEIKISGAGRGDTQTLSEGEWYHDNIFRNDIMIIDANYPILVMQIIRYSDLDSRIPNGGPSLIIAPTTNMYIRGSITFPVFHYTTYRTIGYYIHIITDCQHVRGLNLDNTPLHSWDKLTSSDGEICSVSGSVTSGAVHTVSHEDIDVNFTVAVYGLGADTGASYAYLAGVQNIDPLPTVDEMTTVQTSQDQTTDGLEEHTTTDPLPTVDVMTAMQTSQDQTTDGLEEHTTTVYAELTTKLDNEYASLDNLSTVILSQENVVEVAEALTKITDRPDGGFTDSEIDSVGDIIANIVALENSSIEVTEPVVESISNLIGASDTRMTPTAQITNATSRIVQSLETQIALSLKENDDIQIVYPNIAVHGIKPKATGNATEGIGLAILASDGLFNDTSTILIADDDFDADTYPTSLIYLSSSLVETLKENSTDELRFIFFAYGNDFLFSSEEAIRDGLTVDGPVLAASVEGVESREWIKLAEPVVIETQAQQENGDTGARKTEIRESDSDSYNHEPQCVFWDFKINDWSTKGCRYRGLDSSSGNHQCECDHLTNFAVLVYHGDKHIVSGALDIISKVGCGLSIATLTLTVILLSILNCRKRNRGANNSAQVRRKARTITINLSLSMIGLYVVFLIGIDWTYPEVACTVAAALLHYFLLTSMAWMAVEARFLYIKLVRVFDPEAPSFVIKSTILAWGMPLIAVAVSLGVSLGVGSDDYLNHLYCFPKVGFVVYLAIVLPTAAAILFNMVTFGIIMKSIFRSRPGQNSATRGSDRKVLTERFRSSITIMCLLGLTWIFGFFAIESATVVFQWLFCIMNTLQGVFIFILMCLTQDEVKNMFCSRSSSEGERSSTGIELDKQR